MIKTLKQNDIIKNQYGKRKVLGVCGEVYFLSCLDSFSTAYVDPMTIQELNNQNYTLVEQEIQFGDEYWFIGEKAIIGGLLPYVRKETYRDEELDHFRFKAGIASRTKEGCEELLKAILNK